MQYLTRFSLKNPVAILILSVLLLLGGTYAFQSLKVDLLPNVDIPSITVQAVYPGASPQDVNEKVTTPLENALKTVDNLSKMNSQSYESISFIQLEFPIGTDMEETSRKINELIADTKLPENVEPKANRISFGAFPVIQVALSAKGNTELQSLVENEVRPELQRIPGVNTVAYGGTPDEWLDIRIDREKARQYGLTLNSIKEKINGKNLSFPAGTVSQDDIVVPVRVEEKLNTIDTLKNLVVAEQMPFVPIPSATGGMGSFPGAAGTTGGVSQSHSQPQLSLKQIRLGEIAEIKVVTERKEINRYDRKESLSLTVTKKQDANTVEVASKAFAVLDKYKEKLEYSVVFDQAEGIEKSINSLLKEGLYGALFASLAVLLFLRNLRATLIAILSIPLSLLVASIFLHRYGITLNIMTLGGMAVAVGRVVDDSIVVIENIFRRIRKEAGKLDRTELTASATQEVLNAITSSTLTTIVVFLPLGLVGGITGEFFLPFAMTLVFALLASLLVAVTIVPVLARFAFHNVKHDDRVGKLQRMYARLLEWSLNRKWLIIALSVVFLVCSFGLTSQLGFTFLPNEKQKLVMAKITLPASTELAKTNEVSLKVEDYLQDRKTIKHVFAAVGSRDFQTGLKLSNIAQYFLVLKEEADVKTEVDTLQTELEKVAQAAEKDTLVSVQEVSTGGPPSNNNIDINLFAEDQQKLAEASRMVEEYLKREKALRYVTNSLQETQKQWVVRIDPKKADEQGVSSFMVLGMISDATRPVEVGQMDVSGKSREVRLSYDREVTSKNELEEILVVGKKGPIPLKEVANVEEVDAVSSIQKLDGEVFAKVSAQVDADNVIQVSADILTRLQNEVKLPEEVTLQTGSGSDETTQTYLDLGLAMLVAVGLVYLVMLVAFGKARIPLVILSSLLFVPVGAILGLWITGEPVSISAMIGVLMLIGIVVTNAIVLVDRVGQNREKGMRIREALIEAGMTRLRPILMTAFATICALLPLAFTANEGNLISKGLAVVVIGGLTTSTLLTLVIVPIMYELFFFRARRRERMVDATPGGLG